MSDTQAGANEAFLSVGELVTVARAVKVRGLRGEVVADLLTDFPERFNGLDRVFAVDDLGQRVCLRIQSHWFQQRRIVLKFEGYDSPESAADLLGFEFAVPESERVELPAGQFYEWELEGCSVETLGGDQVGLVSGIVWTGGVEVLVVEENLSGREVFVPMAETICVDIDIDHRLIRIDPPEGLLEM